jgi:hypothetical protein
VLTKITVRGELRVMLTTPKALEEARAHVNCATLPGIELESAGGTGTAGSHLEDYFFFGDIMCGWIYSTDSSTAPTPYGQAYMSRVTLAVLEDMGYYVANWDRAGRLVWASGGGCAFGELPCEEYMVEVPGQPFFRGSHGWNCTVDR